MGRRSDEKSVKLKTGAFALFGAVLLSTYPFDPAYEASSKDIFNIFEDMHIMDIMDLDLQKEKQEEVFEEVFKSEDIPKHIEEKITGVSWNENALVGIKDLKYLTVTYVGFDQKRHTGELVVHEKVADEVIDIFKELYQAGFEIEKIRLIDEYGADDELSMADNNSSAFCFRNVDGTKSLSKHSYGIAIDINPVQNPYIRNSKISPQQGIEYGDRKNMRQGMIVPGDACYTAFKSRGWTWGGEWNTMKDYQHFQKKIDI